MGIEPGGDVVEPPLELRRLRTQRREVGHHPAQAAIMIAQPNGQRLLGEPARLHPLVGFGALVSRVEAALNRGSEARRRVMGVLAWALVVLPFVALAFALRPLAPFAVDVALLYFALGAQSLCEHAEAIAKPLQEGRLDEARQRVGWIVSRDTSALDESGVAKAGMESVLENGNDAIFGTLFWFALLGGPGALLFRLANTLDAMWGYRSERYNLFGRPAARIDDALNWLPARLTALTYALLGHTRQALACWRTQARRAASPSATTGSPAASAERGMTADSRRHIGPRQIETEKNGKIGDIFTLQSSTGAS